MIPDQLEEITEASLQALVTHGVREGLRLEYKSTTPEDRRLAAIACSLANASGGHLVIGVECDPNDRGRPVAVTGVVVADVDAEVLRLDQVIGANLEPPLAGHRVQPVRLESGNTVFVVRVLQSWRRPHRVGRVRHFYGRTSAGKYPLEVAEVRRAFLQSEGQAERIRRFLAERLIAIRAGDLPVPLVGDARLVLHLVPLGALGPGSEILTTEALLAQYPDRLVPIAVSMGLSRRLTLDGFSVFAPGGGEREQWSVVSLRRDGIIEAVDAYLLNNPRAPEERPPVPLASGLRLESYLVRALGRYVNVLRGVQVPAPLYLFVSLLGVGSHHLAVAGRELTQETPGRDPLQLPEVLITDYGRPALEYLRDTFDRMWNAWGREESPHTDEERLGRR